MLRLSIAVAVALSGLFTPPIGLRSSVASAPENPAPAPAPVPDPPPRRCGHKPPVVS
jgi:hypothetical protein